MNAIVWNCRGIGNPRTVDGLKGIISLTNPSIIFLCETLCKPGEMENVKKAIGWKNCFSVACRIIEKKKGGVSRAGGLCLLWKEEVSVSLRSFSDHHIDVNV